MTVLVLFGLGIAAALAIMFSLWVQGNMPVG